MLAAFALQAGEQTGEVKFGGEPVPGVTVVATRGDQQSAVITDLQGKYSFPNLADGVWTVTVQMPGFAPLKRDIQVSAGAPPAEWDLKMLPLDQIKAATPASPKPSAPEPKKDEPKKDDPKKDDAKNPPPSPDLSEEAQNAADGLLINGSTNNGASSIFAQNAAFGNFRKGAKGMYNGGLGFILDNSALDAQSFSLTGQNTPKPSYNRFSGLATLGGPVRTPWFRNGPNFYIGYQWTRNRDVTTTPALMPTLDQRNGIIGDTVIPPSQISSQARALLNLFPLPNFSGSSQYNFELPVVSSTHQDAMQSRLNQFFNGKNQAYGSFAFLSTRGAAPNLFGFVDTTDTLGINTTANWRHTFGSRIFANFGVSFSRLATHVIPYFENRQDVSGDAGIGGNNQSPINWGPPKLIFSSGIAILSDALPAHNRNQTTGLSASALWARGKHNFQYGLDFRRQEFNYLSQQDPRGTFTFTGAATGSDFGDFLTGIPDTSSIAFGNADKYFRESVYDAYFNDDWRVSPELTINAGVRWEYSAPITEKYGRLVNLDIAPGFTAASPVLASDPTGSLTGSQYPSSLVRPDKHGIEPRIGIAWRPLAASSMVIRAGYGVYYNTSVYQNIAAQMAQQYPLSKSLSVQNSPADQLSLASGFNPSPIATPNTFAIDPNFQVGYSQNWNFSVQRDLPGALVATASYLGIKGTRGMQEFLPNTYPAGAANPCPSCPIGFAYIASNGNSTRESGQFQIRRRLQNGLAASLQYTFSKSIDDSAMVGAVAAQNWLDLAAERGLSTFDQRHLLSAQIQYTTGMGLRGGTLLTGWRGAVFKEWTVGTTITAGSGLPLSPAILAPVQGTGITGPVRPDYTGAPLYSAPQGLFLNPAAYAIPPAGEWGNAGRDTITGPSQFALNAALGRTFRLTDRFNLDLHMDATNALNHVTYPTYSTNISTAQFGLPPVANAMRSIQTTVRVRF